jgi:signal transduction histidine kinase
MKRPGKVLVVDDDPTTRRLLKFLLEKEGLAVTAKSNGQEALAQIQQDPPDAVLLDIMMPKMSGFEMLEKVRQMPEHSDLPIIVLTALGDQENVIRGLEMGANDYQAKPIQNQELVARVVTQVRMKCLQDQNRENLIRLQELDDLKDKFILIASHDLRGGLSTIRAGLQLLEDGSILDQESTNRITKILSAMKSSVDEMESLVEGFLDLQAIKAGALKLRMRRLSLNSLIEEAIERFQSYADMKSVSLQCDLDKSLPEAMGDPARLSQVMSNLLSNAIKYSLEGRSVVLRTRLAGDWLRVEVQDSGVGVQEEELPLLFQDFTFGQNRPTSGESSRGVGLSITRQLIELHGGRVGAESTPGAGSLFWFQLPKA